MDERITSLAERLADLGCRHAFGVTGSGPSWQLITALEARGVHYFPVAHEASAALMAGVVARETDSPALSISIKGPGLANMLPGIISNHLENYPAVSVAEAYDASVPTSRKHKRLEQSALLDSVVKGRLPLAEAERLPELWQVARSEAPGPVHVDLASYDAGFLPEAHAAPEGASPIGPLLDEIAAARRPSVVVGSLALRSSWKARLAELRVPVFTTAAAKGAMDERSPYSAGVFTGAGRELAPERHVLPTADLVLGIGLRSTEILRPHPFGERLVLLDAAPGDLADGFGPEAVAVAAGDAEIAQVLEALRAQEWGADEIESALGGVRQELAGPWLPAACFEVLNAAPFAHALVLDTGSFCTIGEHVWAAGPDRPFLGSSNGRYMGVGIPSAIGLSLARPDLPVVCAVGDGGVRMYPAEIRLAVEESLPVCFVLMADGLYGSVACADPEQMLTPRAVVIPSPSWWRAVEGMGCEARPVHSADDFAAALRDWRRTGPLFLEASFDPRPYAEMTRAIR